MKSCIVPWSPELLFVHSKGNQGRPRPTTGHNTLEMMDVLDTAESGPTAWLVDTCTAVTSFFLKEHIVRWGHDVRKLRRFPWASQGALSRFCSMKMHWYYGLEERPWFFAVGTGQRWQWRWRPSKIVFGGARGSGNAHLTTASEGCLMMSKPSVPTSGTLQIAL